VEVEPPEDAVRLDPEALGDGRDVDRDEGLVRLDEVAVVAVVDRLQERLRES
jgi:hypothetical protein